MRNKQNTVKEDKDTLQKRKVFITHKQEPRTINFLNKKLLKPCE